jgi:phage baseplate assembly protein W
MATIDLNNLFLPKKVNSNQTLVSNQVQGKIPVYVDLHLDLDLEKNIGLGNKPKNSSDIMVDTDVEAVKNSIRNLFTTRKGQKLLDPNFGASLEKYLFDPVTESRAKVIGNDITYAISNYEPRIDIIKVYVQTNPTSLNFNFTTDQQLGAGYGIILIYQFKNLAQQNILKILAQIGGQIII